MTTGRNRLPAAGEDDDMSAIVAGADTMEHDMSFRFKLATLALLAPLAALPAIAQDTMGNAAPAKSAMSRHRHVARLDVEERHAREETRQHEQRRDERWGDEQRGRWRMAA